MERSHPSGVQVARRFPSDRAKSPASCLARTRATHRRHRHIERCCLRSNHHPVDCWSGRQSPGWPAGPCQRRARPVGLGIACGALRSASSDSQSEPLRADLLLYDERGGIWLQLGLVCCLRFLRLRRFGLAGQLRRLSSGGFRPAGWLWLLSLGGFGFMGGAASRGARQRGS
jgi:hypothetical protein